MEKLKIVFVDDDQSLLDGLRRFMRRKLKYWSVRFYEDAKSALAEIPEFKPDIVVTDMRMPGMNGIEFLKEVKQLSPHTIRFILSGFSDRELILQSVGVTHQYFAKPVDADTIIEAINASSSLYSRINNENIQNIISNISNLPAPPIIYHKIEAELQKKEPSIEKISKIVEEDVSISAKLLQLVNSAFFGLSLPIADIHQATMFLGVDVLKYLVMSFEIKDNGFQDLAHKIDLNTFSTHSLNVANLSKKIAMDLGSNSKIQRSAFAAGLLHDIGKLLMALYFAENYYSNETFRIQAPDTEETQDLEMKHFGINHADVGAALLALWGLPTKLVNAVAFHHKPQLDVNSSGILSTYVHIANAIELHKRLDRVEDFKNSDLLNMEHVMSYCSENDLTNWINNDEV